MPAVKFLLRLDLEEKISLLDGHEFGINQECSQEKDPSGMLFYR